ncbi:hypothetical protein NHQ30_000464 [Ciborinia camelliae]|nr:hypothetical protein NHQ30_000464 [Ciborinia camelliae]
MDGSSDINSDLDTTGAGSKVEDVSKTSATEVNEPGNIWVPWTPGSENVKGSSKPRHRKTKTGYDSSVIKKISDKSEMENSTTKELRSKIPNFPETAERRLRELTLLHQYTTKTSRTISFTTSANYDQATIDMFTQTIPSIALTNEALLYSIYCISSFHLNLETTTATHKITSTTEPLTSDPDPFLLDAYTYLDRTIRLHRQDVHNLTPLNADAICLTSTNLRVCAFALLQKRSVTPYTPPSEWLKISRSSSMAFRAACICISNRDVDLGDEAQNKSVGWMFVRRLPVLADPSAIFDEVNGEKFGHLLRRTERDLEGEEWDEKIEKAYKSTVCYLGYVYKHIEAKDNPGTVTRLLIGFPYFIERHFVELVDEGKPRAMVLLAIVFAFYVRIRKICWVGECWEREVMGIMGVLGDEWEDVKEEVMEMVREGEADVYEFM